MLTAQDAAIAAASGSKALADKIWYPDVTFGVAAMAQSQRSQAYSFICHFPYFAS